MHFISLSRPSGRMAGMLSFSKGFIVFYPLNAENKDKIACF